MSALAWARWLLARVTPADRIEDLAGLEEGHRRRSLGRGLAMAFAIWNRSRRRAACMVARSRVRASCVVGLNVSGRLLSIKYIVIRSLR